MTLEWILTRAKNTAKYRETKSRLDDLQFGEYADEREDSGEGVLLGNWNGVRPWVKGHGYAPHPDYPEDDTMERLEKILTAMGYQTDWSDEYSSCGGCGKFVRTSPDCYGWQMKGYTTDGEIYCHNCVDENDYLADRIDNPRKHVNRDLVDLKASGFELLAGGYENGLHPGMNDNPVKVLEDCKARFPQHEFVFTINPSQFYIEFDVWGRVKADGLSYMQVELANIVGRAYGLEYALE